MMCSESFFFLFLVDATYDFKQFVSLFAYTDGMIELVFEYWLLILSFHFTGFFISILRCVKHWKIFYTTFSYTLPNTVKWKYFPANILHVKYFTFANILHRNKRSVNLRSIMFLLYIFVFMYPMLSFLHCFWRVCLFVS